MSTVKQAIKRVAAEVPASRAIIIPFLQRHADCGCDDERLASELDEMFAGRAYTTPKGPDGAENKKDFGDAPSMGGPGKWKGKKNPKCFYQTGDPADRCYVTTNGGPGGQKKPDSGSAGSDGSETRQKYNEKYRSQRWNKGAAPVQDASARLAELRSRVGAADHYGYVEDKDGNMVRFIGPTSKANVTKLIKSPAVEKIVDAGGSTTSSPASYMKRDLTPQKKTSPWFKQLPAADKKQLDQAFDNLMAKAK